MVEVTGCCMGEVASVISDREELMNFGYFFK